MRLHGYVGLLLSSTILRNSFAYQRNANDGAPFGLTDDVIKHRIFPLIKWSDIVSWSIVNKQAYRSILGATVRDWENRGVLVQSSLAENILAILHDASLFISVGEFCATQLQAEIDACKDYMGPRLNHLLKLKNYIGLASIIHRMPSCCRPDDKEKLAKEVYALCDLSPTGFFAKYIEMFVLTASISPSNINVSSELMESLPDLAKFFVLKFAVDRKIPLQPAGTFLRRSISEVLLLYGLHLKIFRLNPKDYALFILFIESGMSEKTLWMHLNILNLDFMKQDISLTQLAGLIDILGADNYSERFIKTLLSHGLLSKAYSDDECGKIIDKLLSKSDNYL